MPCPSACLLLALDIILQPTQRRVDRLGVHRVGTHGLQQQRRTGRGGIEGLDHPGAFVIDRLELIAPAMPAHVGPGDPPPFFEFLDGVPYSVGHLHLHVHPEGVTHREALGSRHRALHGSGTVERRVLARIGQHIEDLLRWCIDDDRTRHDPAVSGLDLLHIT